MSIRLETERLILRSPTLDDAEALARAINHPDIAATTLNIPHPYTIEDAKKWLEPKSDPDKPKTSVGFSMFLRETGELIGGIGLMNIDREDSKAELGYWCTVDHWGRGYTTEAVHRMLQYAFNELGFQRVWAMCMVHNPASARVMEKVGMQFEGTAMKEHCKDGVYIDFHHYAILKEEWEKNPRL